MHDNLSLSYFVILIIINLKFKFIFFLSNSRINRKLEIDMENYEIGCFVGRLWIEKNKGPSIIKVKDNFIFDITSKLVPTMSSLLELENPIDYVKGEEGKKIISIEDIENDINDKNFKTKIRLLAPCDLQVFKACGVTFSKSMVERVI